MAEESQSPETSAQTPGTGAPPAAGGDVSALWRRLVEHRIVQWSVGYIAVAYGLQHEISLTSEALEWPHLIERASMILFALGLPVAVTLAWYHGGRINRRISAPELSIIAILLAIGAFLFYSFARPPEQAAASHPAAVQTAVAAPAAKPAGLSVAVLPFLNLSGDAQQEFFSDGMTEEITSALAKIPGLPVVGRTSAFAYKGKNEDLRLVGQALGAAYVLEGSVRKAGNRVRITAQLIRTGDDHHVWTDSYDRDLQDVFAVQEDVAKAIAAALQVPLGLGAGEALVSNRTSDTRAYEDYLRALALYRARAIKQVIAVLEPMVKRDPNYAPAWALLAQAYNLVPVYVEGDTSTTDELRGIVTTAYAKAEDAARKALALDPKHAPALTAIAYLECERGHFADSARDFAKSLALDASDPDTLQLYSLSLLMEGRLKQALQIRLTLRKLEPFVPVYNVFTAEAMQLNGDVPGGAALLASLPADGAVGAQRNGYLALAYAAQGRYALAADTIALTTPDQAVIPMAVVKQAADIIRKAPARVAASGPTPTSQSILSFVYAFAGAPEKFLDASERSVTAGSTLTVGEWTEWHPALAGVRKTERFKALMRKMGLVDYWRVMGWPDLCHPAGSGDFACN